MRYFIDTEFEEYGSRAPIRLLSIGIVAEDGREYYAESFNIMLPTENTWIRENVLPSMTGTEFRNDCDIKTDIRLFIGDDPKPEFWGYYCDYDYVVFANIFGGIGGWPKGWPYLFYDLRQELDHMWLWKVMQDDGSNHNALDDARWVAATFNEHVRTVIDEIGV